MYAPVSLRPSSIGTTLNLDAESGSRPIKCMPQTNAESDIVIVA